MPSALRRRLPGRQVFLFLIAILVPCLVLISVSLRMIEQERQLEEKRLVTQLRQELLSKLDRIKLQHLAARASGAPSPQSIVFAGPVQDGRLLLPWEANPNAEKFRQWLGAAKLREAEQDELAGRLAAAAQRYGEAIAAAPQPAAGAYARLLLARTLQKLGHREEARLQYEQVLQSPIEWVDEYGIPLAFYAAPALRQSPSIRNPGSLPPAALYLLREVATDLNLAGWIRDAEQAEALQSDFPRLACQESVWISYGDPAWLVSLAPPLGGAETSVIAVRAREALASVGARADPAGESLGDTFPRLRVAFPATVKEPGHLRRTFLVSAMVLVVALTLFAGYLLWKDVQRDLRVAEMRSQFVSSVSHELKTPLTAIRMFVETLRTDEDLDRETQTEYLDTIWQQSERLSKLVDNVLDFAKIEQGKKTYHLKPTSLGEVVKGAARAVEYPLAQSGFHLEITAEPDLPLIPADGDALQQAVLNLLTNAMKYSGDARQIGLQLRRENSHALIQVADHGVGIAPEEQSRIFERFYRAPSSENQRIPGTGLGLTLVAHIAKAHGGAVEVASRPGHGSTFTIRLPLESKT